MQLNATATASGQNIHHQADPPSGNSSARPGPLQSIVKQLKCCFVPMDSPKESAFTGSFDSSEYGLEKFRASRYNNVPEARLFDTSMKRSLASVINRHREYLVETQGVKGRNLDNLLAEPATAINNALIKKDSTLEAKLLSDDEFLAINMYTLQLFIPMNKHLRSEPVPDVQPLVDAMQKGLEKLAKKGKFKAGADFHRGLRYQNEADIEREFSRGSVHVNKGFVSVTSDEKTAKAFVRPAHLHYQSKSAVDIHKFANIPREEEVIIPPNTPFMVENVSKSDQTWHVYLKELDKHKARAIEHGNKGKEKVG